MLINKHRAMLEFSNSHHYILRQMSIRCPNIFGGPGHWSSLIKSRMKFSLENYQTANLFLGREDYRLPEPLGMQLDSPPPTSHLLSTEYTEQTIAAIVAHAKNWLSICHQDHDTCSSSATIDSHELKKILFARGE